MASFVLTEAGRNAACNGFVDAVDAGTGAAGDIVIQTTASATLCTIDLDATAAFGAAATGVASITGTPTGTAGATGTAGQFKLRNASNAALATGDVGVGTETMVISNASISSGDTITITTMTVTVPAGT